jgi:phosphoribosylformylglycinamidine synthase
MAKANTVRILGLTDDELIAISRRGLLSLTLEEMRAIKDYYSRLKRNPTDLELETLAQTWSEHCFHKTFKSRITYTEAVAGSETTTTIPGLFSLIREATDRTRKPWCLSLFKDNAGIIALDKNDCVAFKVETHNHPSALEPYGGAGTGIGGVIRDILGAGLGAKPILNTDIFCFGPLSTPRDELPAEVFHPRRLFRGVVSGVRDYGNRMGIPTGNGAILFDEGYLYNILVFCGTVGVMPRRMIGKKVKPGHLVVLIGGRTGRDGIHGATFSSASLEKDIPTSVVQIGNPIVEKKVLDAMLVARDLGLYAAVTDCGAGGLSSAVGELAKDCGARVFLDRVPLKYADLKPWEIWISESQERMVLAVEKRKYPRLKKILQQEGVEHSCIGEFTSSGRLEIFHGKDLVGNLDLGFLFHDPFLPPLVARYEERQLPGFAKPENPDFTELLTGLLREPNIASKEVVVRQYDHEVQARTILKPFVGVDGRGPSDAVVIRASYNSRKGIVVSCGINPFYGRIDPYRMAGCCIEEAIRNCVAVGGNPERIAILDNFCWGDCSDPEELGKLTRCVKGCKDYAEAFGTPFISGKDSLNNFYTRPDGTKISIPGTLLISAVSVIGDVCKITSSDFKSAGNLIYMLGTTREEFGGSHLCRLLKHQSGLVPLARPEESLPLMRALHNAIKSGLVHACHDCSEGGFMVALAEMIIGGSYGAEIDVQKMPRETGDDLALLFSESQGRFIIEVNEDSVDNLENLFAGLAYSCIGRTIPDFRLKASSGDRPLIDIEGEVLTKEWTETLSW